MQTTRLTRSSVLGKRAHQQEVISAPSLTVCEQQLQTPDPTPIAKRVRTSIGTVDGDSNKENVPPFGPELVRADNSLPRSTRSLRRSGEFVTPSRTRTGSRRYASMSMVTSAPATPVGEITSLTITTPPPTPPILLSLHARARALLRSTCNGTNTQIAGRDTERVAIHDFLMSFLSNPDEVESSTSLYISGSPGTGKTALVNAVLDSVPRDAKVIFINCMGLNSLDALWERLIEELGDGKKRKITSRGKKVKDRDVVEGLLSKYNSKCIIVLDELDHITPTTQSLSTLFSLPDTAPSKLRLIGIANTHTLTSSSSSSVAAARNARTLHFAPYTPTQLCQVLQARLTPLYKSDSGDGSSTASINKFLPPTTLTLLTKKIAALTGDVRSLFEVLRGAIDLASSTSSPPLSTEEENPLNIPTPTITPSHILAALKGYTPSSSSSSSNVKSTGPAKSAAPSHSHSETAAKVSNLGLQARLVLLCVVLASRRLEAGFSITTSTSSPKKPSTSPMKRSSSLPTVNPSGLGIDPSQLHAYYAAAIDRSDRGVFEPVSRSEFGDLASVLEGIGLISLGGGSDITVGTGAKRAFGRSSSFTGGAGFGGAGKGRGEVRIAKGVRVDEILRGLGISASTDAVVDVKEEVLRAIWETEKSGLGRELNVVQREKEKTLAVVDGFKGASED